MLVAVLPALPPAVLRKLGRSETDTRAMLRDLCGSAAPDARTAIEIDRCVARGLARVVSREHPDLLVLGSSRRAPHGRVRIGRRARRLLGHARCAPAVAPRGLCSHSQQRLAVIGAGYDGGRKPARGSDRPGRWRVRRGPASVCEPWWMTGFPIPTGRQQPARTRRRSGTRSSSRRSSRCAKTPNAKPLQPVLRSQSRSYPARHRSS
jgi:hypothetical protein